MISGIRHLLELHMALYQVFLHLSNIQQHISANHQQQFRRILVFGRHFLELLSDIRLMSVPQPVL